MRYEIIKTGNDAGKYVWSVVDVDTGEIVSDHVEHRDAHDDCSILNAADQNEFYYEFG